MPRRAGSRRKTQSGSRGGSIYGYADGDPVNFADPFGLKVDFQGNRSLESLWWSIYRTLQHAAADDPEAAKTVAYMKDAMDRTDFTWTFILSQENNAGGWTNPEDPSKIYLNPANIAANNDIKIFPTVMLHEFGHAYANSSFFTRAQSEPTAIQSENSYRRAVGLRTRCGHGHYPPLILSKPDLTGQGCGR